MNRVPITSTTNPGVRTWKCCPAWCSTSMVTLPSRSSTLRAARRQTSAVLRAKEVSASPRRTSPPSVERTSTAPSVDGTALSVAGETAAIATSPLTTRASFDGDGRRTNSTTAIEASASVAPTPTGQNRRRAATGARTLPASTARRTRSRAADDSPSGSAARSARTAARVAMLGAAARADRQVRLQLEPLRLGRMSPDGGQRDPRRARAAQRHDCPSAASTSGPRSGCALTIARSSRRANQMRDFVAALLDPVNAATSSIECSSTV